MPQRQHCPPEKCRGDRNPECHEEQKDVALIHVLLLSLWSYGRGTLVLVPCAHHLMLITLGFYQQIWAGWSLSMAD
jgi:hypothetical protein